MSWIYLVLAGLSEIGFAFFLKGSQQFTKLWPSIWFVVFSIVSFYFMTQAMKSIPLYIVYTVWTGIGIAGICLLEFILFNESFGIAKMLFISMILVGVIGLKLTE